MYAKVVMDYDDDDVCVRAIRIYACLLLNKPPIGNEMRFTFRWTY